MTHSQSKSFVYLHHPCFCLLVWIPNDATCRLSEEGRSVAPLLTDEDNQEANTDAHQCKSDHVISRVCSPVPLCYSGANARLCSLTFCPGTFSYRINSRLFPVPLHSQECCPVCKRHKSSHPHSAAEPALIRYGPFPLWKRLELRAVLLASGVSCKF